MSTENEEKKDTNETEEKKEEEQFYNPELRIDILKGFGADLNTQMGENLLFVNRALVYPIGRHLILRNIFTTENELSRNNEIFIYLDEDIIQATCINVSMDKYLLLVSTEKETKCECDIYNLSKVNFTSYIIFKPRRKIISTYFKRYIYSSFSEDGNLIACIGEKEDGSKMGVIYDVQSFKREKDNNYSPKFSFELPIEANKITFYNNKILCTSGKNHLSFWFTFENSCKEYKGMVNLSKNYVDHVWETTSKGPILITITEDNDLIIFNAVYEKSIMNKQDSQIISRFLIKQTISNIFREDEFPHKPKRKRFIPNEPEEEPLKATKIQKFNFGLVVGSNKGNLLFIEKNPNNDYIPVRYTLREKEGGVTGLAFSSFNEDTLAISFNTNEVAYVSMKNIFQNLRNEKFNLEFDIICDGFHSGPITTMDVALQRPIIVTTSKYDRTVRIWNYLTGHCEYCKIILEEKENNDEEELEILSVAIHPNGYYIAISDIEMIRFFHLCYKELRFYNNDQISNEPSKGNCTMLKFSYGGHLLAALCDRKVYIIRSFSRETVKIINTPHMGQIVTIYFHPNDNYLYTCGNDGLIIQYNLFDFSYVKVSTQYSLYSNSCFEQNYNPKKLDLLDNIISCGYNQESFELTNVNLDAGQTDEISKCIFTKGNIDIKASSVCPINTKRYKINSIAVGSEDGRLNLYHRDVTKLNQNNTIVRFDKSHAHRSKINFLYYSRDTNLLFSAGDDGNLFIYAIYELPDGETVAFEDNRELAMNQLNTILDEGLGDNVLLNLFEILSIQEKLKGKTDNIHKLQRNLDESTKNFANMIKEKVNDLNHKRENEVMELKNKIDEMKLSNDALIDDYEKKIDELNQENRKKFNEREGEINEKLGELNKEIKDLRDINANIKKDFDKAMEDHNYDQLDKFRVLEYNLQKKIQGMIDNNVLLTQQITQIKEFENKKIDLIQTEHQLELQARVEKLEKVISDDKKEIDEKNVTIKKLNDKVEKLEKNLITNEASLKSYIEENKKLKETIDNLRKQLDLRENEKENLTKKLTEVEGNLQEKTRLENFSNQLKNELYKKNYELLTRFHNEIVVSDELKSNSKSMEKQLEELVNIMIEREREMNKQTITLAELRRENQEQKSKTQHIEKEYNNLLKRIFLLCQKNSKKEIADGVREMYHIYVSGDLKHLDSNKINNNLQIELEKKIDFLQNELYHTNIGYQKKESNQIQEFQRKMNENSILIEEMTKIRKINTDMVRQINYLKSQNMSLSNQIKLMQKTNVNNNRYESSINPNENEDKKTNNNIPKTSENINHQYNVPSYSMNFSSNVNQLLPMISNEIPSGAKKNDLRNMKNRIFKPGMLSIPNERLLKYNEMKRIIEGKNDIIQKLTAENHLLKRFSVEKRSSSPTQFSSNII